MIVTQHAISLNTKQPSLIQEKRSILTLSACPLLMMPSQYKKNTDSLVSPCIKKQAMLHSALKIPQDSFNYSPICVLWSIHELAQLVDIK